ncbi:DUF1365 domain-containing protein [Janibacter sp. GXQ6167]|uniref:DUF1365 domain-containing protein n=1 Tax=Janibacter sp. GXQ6167 TaxID=3240791 RepID=UPI0035261F8E
MTATALRVTPPEVPALVVGKVSHARRAPVEHRFVYRHHAWLVDLPDRDEREPAERALGSWTGPSALLRRGVRFDPADHLDAGRLGGGIRGDLGRYLARRGIELHASDRVLMLAQPRSAGYVFNPLSVYWVITTDSVVRAIVAEVHNTYGERHAYLLDPDAEGRSETDKAFYVSPFNDVEGRYRIRTTLRPDRVAVSIALETDDGPLFSASVSGRPARLTPARLARVRLTQPGGSYRTQALIRAHGIWLWLRRLPVRVRPSHDEESVR